MKHPVFTTASLLLFMLLLCHTALAYNGKITVGKLDIVPGLSLQEDYDDNIYLGNGNNDTTEKKSSDWITHILPSLGFRYNIEQRGGISLRYNGDFAMYSSNDSNNWNSNFLSFLSNYKAPSGLIFRFGNTYINADDPYSSENDYNLGQQTKRWSDNANLNLGYEFADLYRVMGYYTFYKQEYDLETDYSQDYNENEAGIGFERRIMPLTWAFARYYVGSRDYTGRPSFLPRLNSSNDADFSWNRINLGLKWDFTSKLNGEIGFGYQWNRADNTFDPYGLRYEDKNTWTAETNINYRVSDKTRLGLRLNRGIMYSYGDRNLLYEQSGIGLALKQKVFARGEIVSNILYRIQDYNEPVSDSRNDTQIKFELGYNYYFKEWLKAGVGYQYWNRNSNYDEYDFDDNQFMLRVGIDY